MGTGQKYLNVKSKRLLGTDDFGTRFLEYMRDKCIETNKKTYDDKMIVGGDVLIAGGGPDEADVYGVAGALGADALGNFLDPNLTERPVPFENGTGITYSVALKHCVIPSGVQVNPRNGNPEYITYEDQIGEKSEPDVVIDNGNGTLTLSVNSVTESGVDCSDRKVLVYLKNPSAGGVTEAIAIEECLVVYVGGDNQIVTTGVLGQSTVSIDVNDYEVVALGATIKRYIDLSTVDGYVMVGELTGVGGGAFTIDSSKKVVLASSWTTMLLKGMTGNLFPKTDSMYDLGTPSKKWANIYTDNLIYSGDFLPNLTDSQDLGTSLLKWRSLFLSQDLHMSGTFYSGVGATNWVGSIIPDLDGTYQCGSNLKRWANVTSELLNVSNGAGSGVTSDLDPISASTFGLGNVTYPWAELYADGVHVQANLYLLSSARVVGKLIPDTTDFYDFGTALLRWGDAYLKGVTTDSVTAGSIGTDKLSLSILAGNGIGTMLVPQVDGAYDIGGALYRWFRLYATHLDATSLTLNAGTGHGVGSNLIPIVNNTVDLGSAVKTWKDLYIAKMGTNLIPLVNGTQDLGSPSFRWNLLYAGVGYLNDLIFSATAGNGIGPNGLMPKTSDTTDLGNPTYRWNALHIKTIVLSPDVGDGFGSHLVPTVDAAYTLGTSGKKWSNIYISNITNTKDLVVSALTGEGVRSDLVPFQVATQNLGNLTYYWNNLYANNMFYKTGAPSTFDICDDLALVEGYGKVTRLKTVVKNGEKRKIGIADVGNIPWPMLGPIADDGEAFIHVPDSVMFLLGALKQLNGNHKQTLDRVEELEKTIEAMEKRIESIQIKA